MEDYYQILGLSHRQSDPSLTANDIKQAYRRALLRHHPDKADQSKESREVPKHDTFTPGVEYKAKFTVDQITTAFRTLSDPTARTQYDREVSLQQRDASAHSGPLPQKYFSGFDTVDLDDLSFDETSGCWYRSCRCGQERGFVVTETELEEDAQQGELVTGCRGCSLWLKVVFQSAEDESIDQSADT